MKDSLGRQIRDLRVSVTDRCNFRCFYCLPHGEPPLARKDKILTFEELELVCEVFVSLGIEKIRLTGGEPLLRKNIEVLIAKLAKLKNPQTSIQNLRLKDLALTTNGHGLPQRAEELKKAGLDRVTISLDSLQREKFRKITGVDRLEDVLRAIAAAQAANLNPVRVNAVIVRGWNDDEIVDLARFARENALSVRFIEFMPLDSTREWRYEKVVSGREIYEKINAVFPLELKSDSRGSTTAWNFSFADGAAGEIGIIAPVTEPFCGSCSRIRLTADGQIRTCLFSTKEHDLRSHLRGGATRAEISEFIQATVFQKEPSHFINQKTFAPASRSMSFIGG
jgi:cyclic pyranopterin phosphate synthase